MTSNQKWSDVLVISPGLESDHNVGWHKILHWVYSTFWINKDQLLCFSVIALFILFNIIGTRLSPNKAAWTIVLILMFFFDRSIILRTMLGRPFIFSNIVTLILLKLWFIDSKEELSRLKIYSISVILLSLAVWIHGTWYTFLLLPMALLLTGQIKKTFELTFCILLSTVIGAFMTGEFNEFLHFHYSATLNIFSEKIYNWQLVTEFAEGNIHIFWVFPSIFIIILLVYSKKLKLNDLSKDPLFILIMLTWLLSIRVVRFWVDWGIVALMYWSSIKLSELISDMESIKKPFLKKVLFITVMVSAIIIIPSHKWNNKKERANYFVDFSRKEFSDFKPSDNGIIYNDSMRHFYHQYFADPKAKYKYILGFEPAIMPDDDKKTFREITYSDFHFKAYEPWINKLTKKDRIFASVDLSSNYPKLDWIKVSKNLYIGKIKDFK